MTPASPNGFDNRLCGGDGKVRHAAEGEGFQGTGSEYGISHD